MKPPILRTELTSAAFVVLLNWLDFSTTTSIIDAKILGTLSNSIGCTTVVHELVGVSFEVTCRR